MIIEEQKQSMVLSDGESQDSIKMSLDSDSTQMLMQMLSKNLYSDAIGSTIREVASNALDSHRRAGKNDPIIVSFKASPQQTGYEFSVEDFGIGLDDSDVTNIISKYGKSTKRNSATELGMMGLGFKAPLAYTSSFYFVARKNGKERKYMMYEGEDMNTIDLVHEMPTDQPDGVKVIVPVQYHDGRDFYVKIKEQLAYFESVYFDVNYNGYKIANSFTIERSEHFQVSDMSEDRNLHLCLDNVYYPLDFSKLGIPVIGIPVGLRFGLSDGIFPTPNREAIRYTTEAKAIIMKKIRDVANYMIVKYNQKVVDAENFTEIVSHYRSQSRYVNLGIEGRKQSFQINNIMPYATVPMRNPSMKGIKLLDLADLALLHRSSLTAEYQVTNTITNNSIREIKHGWLKELTLEKLEHRCYTITGILGGVMKEYLREESGREDEFIIRKKANLTLFPVKKDSFGNPEVETSLYHVLGLKKHPRGEWRERIKEFRQIQDSLFENVIDLDTFVLPQQWLDERKRVKDLMRSNVVVEKKTRVKGNVIGRLACDRSVYNSDRKCKFDSEHFDLEKIPLQEKYIIYTGHDDYMLLDALYSMKRKHQKVKFATFSQREMKLLEGSGIHNLVPYSEFIKGDNAIFKRMASAIVIDRLFDAYRSIKGEYDVIKALRHEMGQKFERLVNYLYKNDPDLDRGVEHVILAIADEKGCWDWSIHQDYLEVKAFLEKYPCVEIMAKALRNVSRHSDEGPPLVEITRDVLKYHKYRLDPCHYRQPASKEVIADDVAGEVTDDEPEAVIQELSTITE